MINLKDNYNISYFFSLFIKLTHIIFHVNKKIYWNGVEEKNPILAIPIKNLEIRKKSIQLPV